MVESQALAEGLTWLALGIYFVGPLGLLLCLGPATARANLFPFLVGAATFLMAWIWIACLLGLWARLGPAVVASGLSFALAFSAFAGLFEESFRYVALRFVVRKVPLIDWRLVLAYAAGHAGGESVLVGITRLQSSELAGKALVQDAAYHLLGAWIVHACFTALVLHAVRCRSVWPLVVAMLWHFGQDMFGPTARSLWGDHAGNLVFLVTNFSVYPCLLVAMLRTWFRAESPNGLL